MDVVQSGDDPPPHQTHIQQTCPNVLFTIAGDWPKVLELARTDPKQAYTIQEDYGNETPLYWACENNAPLDVLQALVLAAPHTLHIQSDYIRQLSIEALLECEPHPDAKENILLCTVTMLKEGKIVWI